jgi:hypothetical protein
MVTRQQANVAAAQDAGRYAGRVADLLEQSHGLAEARPAACRVGHVLEPTKYEEGLGPGACRAVGSRTSQESQGRFQPRGAMLTGVDAEEPVVVESDRETLGALGISVFQGVDQRGIDVGEVGNQWVGPRGAPAERCARRP